MLHLITAIVKPSRMDAIREALEGAGVTVTEVSGYSRQHGHGETWGGTEYQIDFVPKLRFELVVTADDVETVARAIADAARTGKVGDGKLWVSPVESVVRVRTGEQGADAV